MICKWNPRWGMVNTQDAHIRELRILEVRHYESAVSLSVCLIGQEVKHS